MLLCIKTYFDSKFDVVTTLWEPPSLLKRSPVVSPALSGVLEIVWSASFLKKQYVNNWESSCDMPH